MNCTNCGAPMSLQADQGVFTCEYCGSLHLPSPNQDRVRSLGAVTQQLCSKCGQALATAQLEGFQVLQCPSCKGILIRQASFAMLVRYLRPQTAEIEGPIKLIQPQELNRRVRCPECRQDMSTHLYGGPGNIVIDTCPDCELVWLDYGEMHRVLSAPGRDRERWQ